MTLQLYEGDRIYKIIEGKTFGNEYKRFISKIDKNGKITILTYIFNIKDIKNDRTIENENKRMMLLIKEIDKNQFDHIIELHYQIYPDFEIIFEKDYSDKNLEEALESLNVEGAIQTDVPIKSIIDEIRG